MYRFRVVALFCLIYVSTVHSQSMDLTFCDPNNLPGANPPIPFPLPSYMQQYQLNTEVNDGLFKRTIEEDEYFDGLSNRAVTIIRVNGVEIRYIYNDNFNEVLTISGDRCVASKANETTGPITNILINGTEHIVPGLLSFHLSNPNFNEVYVGKSIVRGIPVMQWQSCWYEPNTRYTAKITYSISDPTQWSVAVPFGNISTVIVELQFELKLPNGTMWNQTISVTKFRPGLIARDELWVTPSGIYCENRQPGKPTPSVPKSVKFSTTIVAPLYGYDELLGQITTIRQEYDYIRDLYRVDFNNKNNPILEIYDYKNGLRYIIDKHRGNCSLKVIDPGNSDATIHMNDLQDFFDFHQVNYQYVGEKFINHVHTDVWIGKTIFLNMTVYKEWHFSADGWMEQSDLAIEARVPILLIITFLKPTTNGYDKAPIYYYINDYDETDVALWDFDVSPCADNLRKRRLMFNLPTDYIKEMESDKGSLWLSIVSSLESNLLISIPRISRLNIDFDVDKIFVTFTLLEKAPQVKNNSLEPSLDEAVQLLNETIQAGRFSILLDIGSETDVNIQVLNDSLKDLDKGTTNIVFVNQTVYVVKPEYINVTQYINRTEYVNNTVYIKERITEGYSGGIVVVIAIAMIVAGLGIGLLFIVAYKSNYFRALKSKLFS